MNTINAQQAFNHATGAAGAALTKIYKIYSGEFLLERANIRRGPTGRLCDFDASNIDDNGRLRRRAILPGWDTELAASAIVPGFIATGLMTDFSVSKSVLGGFAVATAAIYTHTAAVYRTARRQRAESAQLTPDNI